jgi:uncharacterized membrane protein YebE (DUF533 family)
MGLTRPADPGVMMRLARVEALATDAYLTSRCPVWIRHREQYLRNSILWGSLRRFFTVV